MPFCRECGSEVSANMKFCPECAAPQQDSSSPKVNMNSLRDNRKANRQELVDRKEALRVKRNLHFNRVFSGVVVSLCVLSLTIPDFTPDSQEVVSMNDIFELIQVLWLIFFVPLIIYNLVAGVYSIVKSRIIL